MTIHQDLASKIMADLRNRNELHKILAPTDPGDGTPWADLKQQAIIEERLAAIIFAELVPIAAEMAELREKVETQSARISEMEEARLTGLADDIARQIEAHDDFDCPAGKSLVRSAKSIADSIVARFGTVARAE